MLCGEENGRNRHGTGAASLSAFLFRRTCAILTLPPFPPAHLLLPGPHSQVAQVWQLLPQHHPAQPQGHQRTQLLIALGSRHHQHKAGIRGGGGAVGTAAPLAGCQGLDDGGAQAGNLVEDADSLAWGMGERGRISESGAGRGETSHTQ